MTWSTRPGSGRRHRPARRRGRCATSGGARVSVRPLRPDDVEATMQVFEGLSPRSRHLRFHAPVHRLSGAMTRALLNVDHHDHVAVVAELEHVRGRVAVGLGRYVRTDPGRAELAVEVADAYHGYGVGTTLLQALRQRAEEAGLAELYGYVLADNTAVQHVMEKVFPEASVHPEGDTTEIRCPLLALAA